MGLSARKDTVRRLVLTRRAQIPETERETRAAGLVTRLLERHEVSEAGTILAFVPHRSEPPIESFLTAVLGAEKRLLLPYVSDDGALRATEVGSLEELAPGFKGIPEPRARLPVPPSDADVVIVPGVAFDARGNRLGYGGGFYDLFLAECGDIPRIGVCFDIQVVDDLPVAEHDLPVDVVVTETRTIVRSQERD